MIEYRWKIFILLGYIYSFVEQCNYTQFLEKIILSSCKTSPRAAAAAKAAAEEAAAKVAAVIASAGAVAEKAADQDH